MWSAVCNPHQEGCESEQPEHSDADDEPSVFIHPCTVVSSVVIGSYIGNDFGSDFLSFFLIHFEISFAIRTAVKKQVPRQSSRVERLLRLPRGMRVLLNKLSEVA
jgi:hypothetical protein